MKKIVSLILSVSLLMTVFVFTGCSKKKSSKETESTEVTEDITPTTSEDIEETTETTAAETEIIGNGYTYQVGNQSITVSICIEDYLDNEGNWYFRDMFADLGYELSSSYTVCSWTNNTNTVLLQRDNGTIKSVEYLLGDGQALSMMDPSRDIYTMYGSTGDISFESIVLIVYACESFNDNPNMDPFESLFTFGSSSYSI